MTVSEFTAEYLYSQGVDCVFEMIGGMTVRLMDAIYRHGGIKIISMHHEQAAAFAACGWAQVKGVPGVALATSGPGATNLVTGIGTAYFDSIPAVFITGQVNQNELSTGTKCRQIGFQETDIVSIAAPITKMSVQLQRAQDITTLLPEAFRTALEGRPGPVLVDIPMNLQKEEIDCSGFDFTPLRINNPLPPSEEIDSFIDKLNAELSRAVRPLMLLGTGVIRSHTEKEARQFAEEKHIPVVYSWHGKGIISSECRWATGLTGTYGNRWANRALARCDLLLILGSRTDVRQIGANTEIFTEGKSVFHIDIDPAELNNRLKGTNALCADLKDMLPLLIERVKKSSLSEDWLAVITEDKNNNPDTGELSNIPGINPNEFIYKLSSSEINHASGYASGVGTNRTWVSQSLWLKEGQYYITTPCMGAMGFALPAAIGASIAGGGSEVIVVAGDGGMQCNIQELEVINRLALPLKIVVMNNRVLATARQFQREICGGRLPGSDWTYGSPDFVKVGEAYGLRSVRMEFPAEMDDKIKEFLAGSGPSLLEVIIDKEAGAYPKMQFGHNLDDMFPFR
ncbi:MAG: thiamine pyrophosphate-binding protein [Synergistes sp.]|nr:thiamine pyrophosphate-binding protein [Synergistes sp.]